MSKKNVNKTGRLLASSTVLHLAMWYEWLYFVVNLASQGCLYLHIDPGLQGCFAV